jgi:hypothetical protein
MNIVLNFKSRLVPLNLALSKVFNNLNFLINSILFFALFLVMFGFVKLNRKVTQNLP